MLEPGTLNVVAINDILMIGKQVYSSNMARDRPSHTSLLLLTTATFSNIAGISAVDRISITSSEVLTDLYAQYESTKQS